MNESKSLKQITTNIQTVSEEIANVITHGVGLGLSIAALVIMVFYAVQNGSYWHVVGVSIFGSSLILLYLNSTIYHAVPHSKKAKQFFRRLDHISIYVLIAGTYTPFTITILRGTLGWTLFGIEWGLALTGICYKIIFGERYNFISTLVYVLMGWMALIGIHKFYVGLTLMGFIWLLLGGLCYTFGVIFYLKDQKIKFFHSIWHLFVLGGSICHFFAVLFYVIP